MVLVDSGDLFFRAASIPDFERAQARRKALAIADGARAMGYDLVCPGEADLALGLPFYVELCRRAGVTVVCANLRVGQKRVFAPTAIRTVDGVRLGFFGLLSTRDSLPAVDGKPLTLDDPSAAAKEAVRSLEGRVDVIVAITHLGFTGDLSLSSELPRIGIIIGGHSRDPLTVGGVFAKTAIFQGGYQGRSVGEVRFTVAPAGGEPPCFEIATPDPAIVVEKVSSRASLVLPSLAEDPACAALVKDYRDWVTEEGHRRASAASPSPRPTAPSTLVWGAARCGECHPAQLVFWRTTAHARAFRTLVDRSKQYDVECLACHTTRLAETRRAEPGRRAADVVGLESVQCEACHEAGTRRHSKESRARASLPSTCLACHQAKNSPRFDPRKWLPRVRCPAR